MDFINSVSVFFAVSFLSFVLSYYFLLFLRPARRKGHARGSITIIIPAHNEEAHLSECISSVLDASFAGRKQVIVVDDGSKDRTFEVASRFKVTVIRTPHLGKAAALNKSLSRATGYFVAVVDGDSVIEKSALQAMADEIVPEDVAAAACVVKVKNRHGFGMWLHVEQVYNSLMRSIFSKVNANITTPGPLSMYKRKALLEIGGFSRQGFSEDADIAIRLIRKGHRVVFCDSAVSETYMPSDFKGIASQRSRFARGTVNLLKRHLRLNNAMIDLYTLPLLLFLYAQAVIMGLINIYLIVSGYFSNFASHGVYFSAEVLQFFFEWFSLVGFLKWAYGVAAGSYPLTFLSGAIIIASLLSYPLFFYAILKYDKKLDFFHIIPLMFMFPFWLFVTVIYLFSSPELFRGNQPNIWNKN